MLNSKKILLGICSGIAAYKILILIRLLKKAGAEVKVVLTPSSSDFVGKVSLSALSGNPVWDQFTEKNTGDWNNHVELGLWADLFLIAPLTANTLSKMATGQSDNLLLATYLSSRCPVFVAPAMDLDMWTHPSTQRNIKSIKMDGVQVIEPGTGLLASGLEGKGRMEEPENLFHFLGKHFQKKQDLEGKKVLVTLGPTQEPLDPVRFISNHSSGKMGAELCNELSDRGAQVFAVCGPISKSIQFRANSIYQIQTADQMHQKCMELFSEMDAAILAAAVADYTPIQVSDKKIKKENDSLSIQLRKTIDIAGHLGSLKKNQFLIGFALETDNEIQNAKAKLLRKNLNAIVLNSMNDAGAGFGHSTNKITILKSGGEPIFFDTKSKKDVAKDIIDFLVKSL